MAEGIETPCLLDFYISSYGKWLLPNKGFSMYSSKAGGQNVRQLQFRNYHFSALFLNTSIKNIQEGHVQLLRSLIMNLLSFVNKGIMEI